MAETRHIEAIAAQGYTIVEGVLDGGEIAALRARVLELEDTLGIAPAPNIFEGQKTLRIYNLLA
ncbi:MAG: hypothetical protein KC503_38305, partial [Myxococcales bacterium]|nr:hypothetical protein [Myxococcales bacterium]